MLMVWVYDHTQSVLLAMLMHLPLIVFLFNLVGPALAGVPELIFNLVFGATLWVFVAAVARRPTTESSREGNTRPPLHSVRLSEHQMTGVDPLRDRLCDERRTFVLLIDGLRLQARGY
jgi:hypothetical protein